MLTKKLEHTFLELIEGNRYKEAICTILSFIEQLSGRLNQTKKSVVGIGRIGIWSASPVREPPRQL